MDKKRNAIFKRPLALFLAFALMLGTLPDMRAYAEGGDSGLILDEDDMITAFDALPQDVASQIVTIGTPQEALALPDTLDAEVDGVAVTVHTQSDAEADSMAVTVPVAAWQSSPEYDGDAEGLYIFTPELSGEYTVAEGVAFPTISVTVEEEKYPPSAPEEESGEPDGPVTIAAFALLADDVASQSVTTGTAREGLALPDTLAATGAEDEDLSVEGVSWRCDTYDGDTAGEYTFAAVLPAGYTLAEGVSLPEITVTVRVGIALRNTLVGQTFEADGVKYTVLTNTPERTAAVSGWGAGGALATLTIPAEASDGADSYKVTEIAAAAFWNETSVTTLDIAGAINLIKINYDAFRGWSNLTANGLDLSGCTSLATIGNYAFRNCGFTGDLNLSGLTSLATIGNDAFNNSGFTGGLNLSGCTSLATIGNYAFMNSGFTGDLNLSGCTSLAAIGNFTFMNCGFTGSLDLSGCTSLAAIGNSAFYQNYGITEVRFPASLTSLENVAFGRIGSLATLRFYGATAPTLVEGPFSGVAAVGTVYYPSGATGYVKGTFGNPQLNNWTFTPFDAIPPVLTAGDVTRTGDTSATVKFTSNKAGQYYYAVVDSGAPQPFINTAAAGTACDISAQTLSLTLTAGAKDVYIVVKDADGNVSDRGFKLVVPAWNTPPNRIVGVPANATASVTVNTAYTLDLSTIFEDTDGDPLTYTVSVDSAPAVAAAESYSYTPAATGTVTLAFKANDGTVDSTDTYTVTLTVNTTPPSRKAGIPASATADVTVNTAYTLDLSTIFEDADGDPLTYTVSIDGAPDMAAAENYSYTPAVTGTVTLVFKANDGTVDSTDTYTVTLTVNTTPPSRKAGIPASATADVTVNTAYTLDLSTIFEDADGDPLTYTVSIDGAPDMAAAENYSYTPAVTGTVTLVFKANDGTVDSTDTYTVTLTVNTTPPSRKAGVPANTTASVTVNTAYTLGLSTIFEDANGDPLTYTVSIDGAPDMAAAENYNYTPTATGTVTLVFKANDGTVDSTDTYTVTLSVNPAAPDPELLQIEAPDDMTVAQGQPLIKTLSVIYSGSGTLTYSATGLPPGVSIDTAAGAISGTPTIKGDYAVTIAVTDQTLSNSASFTIHVQATYAVTFNPNGGSVSPTTMRTETDGKLSCLPTPTRSNYSFNGWYTAARGGTRITADTVFAVDTTVYAHWSHTGNGGSSSSDSDSSSLPTTTYPVTVTTKPDFPTTARLTLTASPDINAALSCIITKDMAQQTLDKAKEEAQKQGCESCGYSLEFNFSTTATIASLNITFNADALALLESAGIKEATVTTNAFRFGFDLAAVEELNRQRVGNAVTVTASRFGKLSDAAKAYIGDRPAWDITISYKNGGKTENISNLGKGAITMGMKYTPALTELTGSLVVVYVPDSGQPQVLTESSYDNGWMIWQRSSLSVYGVGYITPTLAVYQRKRQDRHRLAHHQVGQ